MASRTGLKASCQRLILMTNNYLTCSGNLCRIIFGLSVGFHGADERIAPYSLVNREFVYFYFPK